MRLLHGDYKSCRFSVNENYYPSNRVWSCGTESAGRAKHSATLHLLALLIRQRLIAKR